VRPDHDTGAQAATPPAPASEQEHGAPVSEAPDVPTTSAPTPDALDPEIALAEDAATGPDSPSKPAPADPEPDWHDKYLRAVAELDNVRKRARRDIGNAESRGIAKLARELLPGLDNLDRALAAAESQPENADHHLTNGIRLVQQELAGALARVGVEADAPKGEPFDPHRHEAVAQQPVEGVAAGTIVEVYQAGYRYGDDVIRAAKVVVSA